MVTKISIANQRGGGGRGGGMDVGTIRGREEERRKGREGRKEEGGRG